MTIDFYEISEANEVPSSLTEVGSTGPVGAAPKKVLIIGHRLTTGTVAADTVFTCPAKTSGLTKAGTGSQVGEMVYGYKTIDPDADLYAIGLADDGSGVAASGSIAITGVAATSYTLEMRIGGRYYYVGVTAGDSAVTTATALKAAIDADTRRLLTSSALSTSTIPLACRWKGPSGNNIDIRQIGTADSTQTVTVTALSSGATAPSVSAAISAIAAEHYDTIILGLSDTTTIAAFETEMARRFQGGIELRGSCFYGLAGSVSTVTTYLGSVATPTRNSKHLLAIPRGESPSSPWDFATDAAARDTITFAADAGRPRIGLVLTNCLPPDIDDRWEHSERQSLLVSGASTWTVNADGQVVLERLITNYKVDTNSVADSKFKDQTSMRVIHDWTARWRAATLKFLQYKLVDDDTPVAPGVKAITASYGKALQDGLYEEYATTGNVQNVTAFKAASRCERHATIRTRLNFYQPIRIGDIVVTLANRIEVA